MKTHNRQFLSGFFALTLLFFFFIISRGEAQKYTWIKLNDMIYPSAAHASCISSGKVYAIGGTDKTMHGNEYGEAYVQIYNPESGAWNPGQSMQFPRMMLGVAQVNGIIYAIGGGYGDYLSDANEAYDPSTNTWTVKAPTPTTGSCFGISVVNNKIYIVGGMHASQSYPTEVYDPATDQWSSLAPIPHPVAGIACAAVDGKIYSIGGVDNTYTCVDLLQVYDIATNTWETKQHMPYARFGAAAAAIGNKIYVFGGAVFPVNTATSNVQIYDIGTNTWSNEDILPIPTQWAAVSAGEDNSVYLLAGENKCMMTYSDATIYKFLYKFKVNSTGIETLNGNNDCSLSIIPNPVTQQVKIKYRTVEDGLVTLEMYNITGNKIDVLTNRFERQGVHEITQNMVNLPAGIYFCRLKSGAEMRMEKVVKIN